MQNTLIRILSTSIKHQQKQTHLIKTCYLSSSRSFNSTSIFNMPFKVGDTMPNVDLFENTPGGKVNIKDLCKDKKVIVIGVPGAFTPNCSKTHLPGYVESFDQLKKKGIDEVVCISVNDPFVMAAWGENQKCSGKVRMLADTNGQLTHALDLEIDLKTPLGSTRTKRFASIFENGVCKVMEVEADGTGLTCTISDNFIKKLTE